MMEKILLVLAISLLSGLATYYISHVLQKGSVLGSAIIVLVSGIVFPSVFGSAGTTMAVAATAASYAGMVSKDNVVSLLEMSLVSMLCGVIFLVTTPAYSGVGGKLGTIAAIACLSFKG